MNHRLSASPLLERTVIDAQVRRLASEIVEVYGSEPVLVIGLMNGVFVFLADLCRSIPRPLNLAFLRASSYGQSHESSGQIRLDGLERLDFHGQRVLLVDDILDTGRTLSHVRSQLLEAGARDVRLCVLLDKPSRRLEPCVPDFCGFQIEDRFVVGYGLDYAEQYRNFPEIWEVELF